MNNQQSIWMTTSMITSTNSLFICLHTTCFWRAAPKNSQSGQNFEMLVLVDRGKERRKAKRFLFVHFSRLPYELRQRRFEVTDQRGLKKKDALYLSVNVFSRKVLIGETIFTSRETAILRGHRSHAKVSPFVEQRMYLHFSVILRP